MVFSFYDDPNRDHLVELNRKLMGEQEKRIPFDSLEQLLGGVTKHFVGFFAERRMIEKRIETLAKSTS